MEGGEERESRREDRKGGGRRVILQTCYRSITLHNAPEMVAYPSHYRH